MTKWLQDASVYFKGNVGVMMVSWLIYAVGSSITVPYLSIYMKMLGADSEIIGIIYSLGMLSQLITIIPGGLLTDTIGRRRSILIGTWGVAGTTLLYVLAPNWESLLAIYIINSAIGFYQPALMATILDSLPSSKRASGVMLVSVLPQLPTLILPPLGGALINRYGLLGIRFAYLISTIMAIIVAVIRHKTLVETLNETRSKLSLRELLASYDLRSSILRLHARARFLLVIMLIASATTVSANTLVPIYAIYKLNLNTVAWGTIVAAANAAYIIVGVVTALYIDKMRHSLLIIGSTTIAVANVFGLLPLGGIAIAVYLIIIQIGAQVVSTSIQSDMGDYVDARGRGNAISLLIIFQLIGQSLGSYIAGITYRLNPLNIFMIPLIIMIATTIAIWFIIHKRH